MNDMKHKIENRVDKALSMLEHIWSFYLLSLTPFFLFMWIPSMLHWVGLTLASDIVFGSLFLFLAALFVRNFLLWAYAICLENDPMEHRRSILFFLMLGCVVAGIIIASLTGVF